MPTCRPHAALAISVLAVILAVGACGSSDSTSGSPAAGNAPTTDSAGRAPRAGAAASARLARIGTFKQPLYVTSPPGDATRIFVVEKGGKIRMIGNGKKQSKPFLNISGEVSDGSEQGLLSLTFAPDYAQSRKFYIDFTDGKGDTRIQEFRSNSRGNRAIKGSRRQLMKINQPFENHNGGLVLFGPDKLLYIGMGDGGSGNDPGNRAQSLGTLLGKLLRIDPKRSKSKPYTIPADNPFVGKSGARGEIYSYGLRNPWRFSFDRETAAIYIGDVGQDTLEEIDYEPEGKARGVNFGWPAFEGKSHNPAREDATADNPEPPILDYGREGGECSVTGGYVVRDPGLSALVGRYVYGDFCTGKLRSFVVKDGKAEDDNGLGLTVSQLSSFGEDASGHIYATSLDGPVYRLKAG